MDPSDTVPVIRVSNLTKRFPPPRKGLAGWRTLIEQIRGVKATVTALEDISFEVRPGEIFGLLGPNGAGKTTFCKILNALVIPTSGRIEVWGHESVREHQRLAQAMITIFGGESDLFGLFSARLSTERNLQFVGDLWGLPRATTQQRLDEALELLDLEDKRDEWYQKLSGGTKQKLFLAIPLILRRPLVVLDEPTIRLDVPTRRKGQEVLKGVLNRQLGTTIVLTTHDLTEAERLCDRIAILNRGRLALVDTPQGLRKRAKRGPRVVFRVRLENGRASTLREAFSRALPELELKPDLESDRARQDGLTGFSVQLPRLQDGEQSPLPRILEALAAGGLAPETFTMEEPTLEDVFVDLLGEQPATD